MEHSDWPKVTLEKYDWKIKCLGKNESECTGDEIIQWKVLELIEKVPAEDMDPYKVVTVEKLNEFIGKMLVA